MADKHERANGAVCREHEIALPNELTVDPLITLKEGLVRELVGNLINTQSMRQMER